MRQAAWLFLVEETARFGWSVVVELAFSCLLGIALLGGAAFIAASAPAQPRSQFSAQQATQDARLGNLEASLSKLDAKLDEHRTKTADAMLLIHERLTRLETQVDTMLKLGWLTVTALIALVLKDLWKILRESGKRKGG